MATVTRLVTHADVDGPDTGQVSVSARHEAELDDGRRVLLLDDRGWSSTQAWNTATPENLRRTARMVVGPDEPYGPYSREDIEVGHWICLRQILRRHGVLLDVAELQSLPHDVLLSQALVARTRPNGSRTGADPPGRGLPGTHDQRFGTAGPEPHCVPSRRSSSEATYW